MAYHPNIPTPTGVVQDELAQMRENFQHLDPLAQAVGELQGVSELAPYVQALLDSRVVDHNLDVAAPPNGWYVRWENGLQMCWHYKSENSMAKVEYRSFQWTYPAKFSAAPRLFGSGGHSTSATSVWGLVAVPNASVGTGAAEVSLVRLDDAGGTSLALLFNLVAVGRWK